MDFGHEYRASRRSIATNSRSPQAAFAKGNARPGDRSGRVNLSRGKALRTLVVDLGVGDLAGSVLLPNIHHVIRTGDVALLIVAHLADHGLELLARLDHLGDLLRAERLR